MSAIRILTLVALVPSLAVADEKPRAVKVAFVVNNAADFWLYARAGAVKAAREQNVELIFKIPQQGTVEDQNKLLDDLPKDVKSVVVVPIDPAGQKAVLEKLAGRVHLLTVDNDAPDSKRKCCFVTDQYEAGREAGRQIKQAHPDGGAVALFVGRLDSENAKQRRQGLLDELAGKKNAPEGKMYGKFELLDTHVDNVNVQKARENAKDVLLRHGDKKDLVLVGLWAYNPPAILSAVKDMNKQGKATIVGFDEDEQTLQGVRDGHIRATIVMQPYEYGVHGTALAASLARDASTVPLPSSGVMNVPVAVVTKDRAEEYRKRLDKLKEGDR